MSGGDGGSEQKTKMPGYITNPAKKISGGITGIEAYEGPIHAGMSDYTQQAMQGMGAPGGYDQSIDYYQRAAQGDFLGLSPEFQGAVMNPAIENVASRFARSGRSGSPAAELSMTEAAMRSLAPYYADERRMQQQAAAALPMAHQDLYRSQLAAGGIQEGFDQRAIEQDRYDPRYDQLQRQIGLLQGIPSSGGTVAVQQDKGSALAGAAGGAAMGTAIMPGWGTAIGAGLGLLGSM